MDNVKNCNNYINISSLQTCTSYNLQHNVSETGFCLRLQVEPVQLGQLYICRVINNRQDDG
jgi:hypothetical protein